MAKSVFKNIQITDTATSGHRYEAGLFGDAKEYMNAEIFADANSEQIREQIASLVLYTGLGVIYTSLDGQQRVMATPKTIVEAEGTDKTGFIHAGFITSDNEFGPYIKDVITGKWRKFGGPRCG